MDYEQVGKAFVQHYYNVFDTNRSGLSGLYRDQSLLTFEGEKFQGVQNISQKLQNLPFQQVKHNATSLDCQPSLSGGIMVFVCGNLLVEGSDHPLNYSQVFHLSADPQNAGNFWVSNDMFRLNYG